MSETTPVARLTFEPFGKIARLSRECVVTEKIDGTNASVWISDDPAAPIVAGSRTRFITPASDNFGFAAWVQAHADELRGLGPGRHFGEWWGSGIQRSYGLANGERRFSLFNTTRWYWKANEYMGVAGKDSPPSCCSVVPVLYAGVFRTTELLGALDDLHFRGSRVAPGFMKPEGIIAYHIAAGVFFKKTIEKDDEPKARAAK